MAPRTVAVVVSGLRDKRSFHASVLCASRRAARSEHLQVWDQTQAVALGLKPCGTCWDVYDPTGYVVADEAA